MCSQERHQESIQAPGVEALSSAGPSMEVKGLCEMWHRGMGQHAARVAKGLGAERPGSMPHGGVGTGRRAGGVRGGKWYWGSRHRGMNCRGGGQDVVGTKGGGQATCSPDTSPVLPNVAFATLALGIGMYLG